MDDEIRAQPQPSCLICGSPGRELYAGLEDRLFDAPGKWRMSACTQSGCGLLWLDPMPDRRDIARAYRSYYTHDVPPARRSRLRDLYRNARAGWLAHRWDYGAPSPAARLLGRLLATVPDLRVRFDFSVMWLPAKTGGRLLEVGCGSGDALVQFAGLGWQVEGVDADPRAAEAGGRRGVKVVTGELHEQRYPDGLFDAIVLSHVIEHVHDPHALVAECHRILSPGGRLIILTPNASSLGHRQYGRHWLHLDPPRHLHIFNSRTLPRLAEGLAFSEMECRSVIRDANWTLAASRRIRREGRYTMGRLGLLERARGYLEMYREWLALRQDRDAGEEVLLRLRK